LLAFVEELTVFSMISSLWNIGNGVD